MAEFRSEGINIQSKIEPYRSSYNRKQTSTTTYPLRLAGKSFDYDEVRVSSPTTYHLTLDDPHYGSFPTVPLKGYLPSSNLITSVYNKSTTSYMERYFVKSGEYYYLSTSSSSASGTKLVPSDKTSLAPQLFILTLQGGGGGGAAGDGGGGGGGGFLSLFVRAITLEGSYLRIGYAGKGTVHNVSDPTNGTSTALYDRMDQSLGRANGGNCGTDGNHGQRGGTGGSYTYSNSVRYLLGKNGGKGGNIGKSGSSVTQTTLYTSTYTGQSNIIYSAQAGGTGAGGGGGGASAQAKGANANGSPNNVPTQPSYGAGGGGTGKNWLGVWWNAGNGGGGRIQIFY